MKFQDWLTQNSGRRYADILKSVFVFDDPSVFEAWLTKQRLGEYQAGDWAMLAIALLDERIRELEKQIKVKDKK